MSRIAPSAAFASIPSDDLGQGDRINLGVASILGHRPKVAGALGAVKAALQANGTLSPRLVELVRLRIAFSVGAACRFATRAPLTTGSPRMRCVHWSSPRRQRICRPRSVVLFAVRGRLDVPSPSGDPTR